MVGFPKFEGGVHHDVKPQPIVAAEASKPRMSMADRFASRLAEAKAADTVADKPDEVSTPEDDRVHELVKAVNERTSERASRSSGQSAEAMPMTIVETPIRPEASAAEAIDSRSEADLEQERKQMAAEMAMRAVAAKKAAAARFVSAQGGIAAARAALMKATPAPKMAYMPEAPAYQPPSMPVVDPNRKLNIPKFGEAQILFVDPESQMVYFATPAERARVDKASIGNEFQGSRDLANFSKDSVVALTPGQVRDLLAQQPVQPANTRPMADRYAA
jgi:hypothetical protein